MQSRLKRPYALRQVPAVTPANIEPLARVRDHDGKIKLLPVHPMTMRYEAARNMHLFATARTADVLLMHRENAEEPRRQPASAAHTGNTPP